MKNLQSKTKSFRINWNNILEQAIGTLFAAAAIGLFGYILNLITGKTKPTIWFWAGLACIVIVVIFGSVWKTMRKIVIALGKWIIQNWKLIMGIVLILLVSYFSYLTGNFMQRLIQLHKNTEK